MGLALLLFSFFLFVLLYVIRQMMGKCLPRRAVVKIPGEASVLYNGRQDGGVEGVGAGLSVPMGMGPTSPLIHGYNPGHLLL